MLRRAINIFCICIFFQAFLFAQQIDTLRLNYIEKSLPFGLTKKVPENLPQIGLALSGGGARALTQLGVLKAFEEKKIPIENIVGTSMGSIIGGLYSAGYSLTQLDSILNGNNWEELYSAEQSKRNDLFVDQKITEDRALISLRLEGFALVIPNSISSGQRPANFLNLLSLNAPIQPEKYFSEYLFNFRAIASNLVNGEEVVLDKIPLGLAMRASSSVTFLLPPVKKDTMLLVDGGLVANIPAKETRDLGSDIVVAVNSSSPLYDREELEYPWTIADQLVSIPMQKLNRQQIEQADYIITPDIGDTKNTDFSDTINLVEKGYQTALPFAEKISDAFENKFKDNIDIPLKFYKNLTIKNSGNISIELFNNIINKDSVSNKDLLFELYRLNISDEYKDLFFELSEEGNTSSLKVISQPNLIVKDFIITGDSLISRNEIGKRLSPLVGKPFSSVKTLNAALEIMRLYKSRGFSFASIDNLKFDSESQILFIDLSEGIISKIIVTGNTRTKERLITRELPLNVGDIFKYEKAEKGLTNLRSTNMFDQVELDVKNASDSNEVTLDVLEKISGVIRLGMRIDNENFSQVSVDVRDENINGTGTELGATVSGGVRNRSFVFEQKANRVFDSFLTYKVRAFYEFNDVNVYSEDSTITEKNRYARIKTAEYRQIFYGGSFGIGAQAMRLGNLFAEVRFQKEKIKNKSNYFGKPLDVFNTSLRFSLLVDTQNDYPYPTDGFLIKSYYETAQSALGGDIGYTKLLFDYKNFFSPYKGHTISLHGVIGSGDNTLPLTEQFSLGGQNSFSGFRDNEYRGRQILSASLEYRYNLPFKIFFDTYLKARYDLGSIWGEREQIRFKDLKHGVGASLSFNTPIGPADFSIGRSFYFSDVLSKNTINWGPTYFYFTIGYYY
jgi:NTE family protein